MLDRICAENISRWALPGAKRYANYKGGKKYDKKNDYSQLERGAGDEEKLLSNSILEKNGN